jgi:oligoribonuclease NrnB/cAMP/cGMP phosphodiesterase (DHH superfamily)
MTNAKYSRAREFLEEIKPEDRVGIIYHDDLDGFASGILFYNYCIERGVKDIKPITFSYGKTKPSKLNLEDRTKLLIADVAPNQLVDELPHFKVPIFYTDHHQTEGQKFEENVVELRTIDEGYIPSCRTVYELCGGKKWWALLGVWGDTLGNFDRYKENKDFFESGLKELGLDRTGFMKLWLSAGNFLIYYAKDYPRAFEFLVGLDDIKNLKKVSKFSREVEKEIHRVYIDFSQRPEILGGVRYHYFESPFEIKSAVINKLSMKKKEEIMVLASPKSGEQVSVSARNQVGIYDVDKMLKIACEGIQGANPGGHKSAAGVVFRKVYLRKFKENLSQIDIEEFRQ